MTEVKELAFQLMMMGNSYCEAARTLSESVGKDEEGRGVCIESIPLYHLINHSAELYFKTALVFGYQISDEKILKNDYGHKLQDLLATVSKLNVSPSVNVENFVNTLAPQIGEQTFTYNFWDMNAFNSNIIWPVLDEAFDALEEIRGFSKDFWTIGNYTPRLAPYVR
jgi:hypothetical protein